MENKLKQGEALFAEGKIEEAEKCFLESLNENSKNKEVYNNLGVIAFQRQNIEQAINHLTISLEIDPFYKDAVLNYSQVLKSLNLTHEVIPLLEKVMQRYPDDHELLQLLHEARLAQQPREKISVLCLPGLQSFLGDIVAFLETKYEVRTCYSNNNQEIESAVKWADIIWLEWANEMAIHVTNNVSSISGKQIICRVHSYEVLQGYIPRINWSVISKTIFVADHVAKIARDICPAISKLTECVVVNNGVNLKKFQFKKRNPGFNIAVVGSISHKKNPSMWVEVISRLVRIDDRYTLKIAGEFQELRYKCYMESIIPKLGLTNNMRFYGQVGDITEWFEKEQINYLLTTSPFESFGYSIAEAMAMGYRPLIHAFAGAEDIWPALCIFYTINELIDMVRTKQDYESRVYREFVMAQYSLRYQLERIDSLVTNLGKKNSHPVINLQEAEEKNTHERTFSLLRSSGYWEKRYDNGGTSGAGSYGKLAEFKAERLNTFVRENNVRTVIELGCGDGNQLALASYPSYVGLDISKTAIRLCQQRFRHDKTKLFLLYDPNSFKHKHDNCKAELALSLDVIYHLVEDDVFECYMEHLFSAADKYVIIYSSNFTRYSPSPHIKYRRFSEWITSRLPDWKLLKQIPNRYPYQGDEGTGSLSDFYIYGKNCSNSASKGVAPDVWCEKKDKLKAAEALISRGQLDLSETYLLELIDENRFENTTDIVKVILRLSAAYLEQQQWEKAEVILTKAEYLDPSNTELANNLGAISFQTGNFEKAKEYFVKAANGKPADIDAMVNLGDFHATQGDAFAAIKWYRNFQWAGGSDTSVFNRAGKLAGQNYLFQDAVDFFKTSLKFSPDQPGLKRAINQFAPILKNNQVHFYSKKLRVAIFTSIGSFIGHIEEHLKKYCEVKRFVGKSKEEMFMLLKWADVAWFDSCDNLLIYATQMPKVCRIVCRLQSFELFTHFPQQVRWPWVDELIFVSEHVRGIFFKQNRVHVKSRVIPNGVDYNKFSMPKKKKYGKKIAYVGSINHKKNPSLLLQIFKAIKEYDSEFSFYIAGEFQELSIKLYWERMDDLMNLDLKHDGQVDDVAAWLEDKDYIITTSYFESFQYAVAEGIGRGLMPLVHKWQGADQFYPENSLFLTPYEAVELVKRYRKNDKHEIAVRNRNKLISTNDVSVQLGMIDKLLKEYEPKVYRNIAGNDSHRNRDYVKDHPRSTKLSLNDYEPGLASIIIPTYNRGPFIVQCIESAIAQTYPKVEIIVVDDGSTDNTREILAKYMDRIVYIPQENQGVSGALNTAIRASRGEYISWLSSDDAYPPDKVEVQVKELTSTLDIDWVYSDFYYMDEKSVVGKKAGVVPYTNLNIVEELFNRNTINGCSVLFKRKVLEKTGLFDTELGGRLGYGADGKMWCVMGYYYKFKFIPKPIVYYRWHKTNASHEVDIGKGWSDYIEHMQNWFSERGKIEPGEIFVDELKPVHRKIKKDGMNILWVGLVDPCGNAAMIAKAINDYTPHTCRVATLQETLGFDSDIVCQRLLWAGDDKEPVFNGVKQLADRADLLIFSAAIAPGCEDPGNLVMDTDEIKWGPVDWKEYSRRKPSAAFFFGSMTARRNSDFYRRLFKDKGWPIFTGQLDLHQCWPDSIYVPIWIDIDHPRYNCDITQRESVVITQSLTNRAVKNTAELIRAVENIRKKYPYVELDLIENVSFKESLAHKAEGDIGFDQMQPKDGYYCLSSIENSALGLVNIVHLNDFARKKILETTGAKNMPWYDVTSEDQLIEVLDGLVGDRDRLYKKRAETARWIRQYWHPQNLVNRLTDELEKLL